ncbi:tissue factor pathway inhibitor 2 [Hyalella azteca]|nr:tissue factor pathway inhibitor 2 [Hyalella azteca]
MGVQLLQVVALASALLATTSSLMLGFDELSSQFLPLAHVSVRCLQPIDYVPRHCTTQDMVRGRVIANETMWYYSPDLLKCVPTIKFTGCATENRFDTLEACTATCETGTHCPDGCYTETDLRRRDKLRCVCPDGIGEWLCHLPPDEGDCGDMTAVAPIERYYYDPVSKECHTFSFSRCGGNNNNYGSLLMCKDICAYDPASESTSSFALLLLQILIALIAVVTILHLISWKLKTQSAVLNQINEWLVRRKRASFL